MNKFRFIILIFFSSVMMLFVCRSDGIALNADELLLVANSAVAESAELARYYMLKRKVPKENLLVVRTSAKEQIGRSDYDLQIAHPVRKFLAEHDPEGKRFKCITLMYGMPLRVLPPPPTIEERFDLRKLQASLKERTEQAKLADGMQTEKPKELQEQLTELRKKIQQLSRTNWGASVDSELALVREKTYQLEGWLPNRHFLGFYGKKIKNMPQLSLLVSRLDGPTPVIVRRIIDDSIYAEEQGLSGKAYFDARWSEKILQGKHRKLSAYQLYDRAIHNTARMIQKSKKLPVVVDDEAKLFASGEAPGAALYCGWYSRARYVDAFTWARGAVGYHVASSECVTLKAPGSTVWCKVMLEKGVAATLGPVTEPYLQSFPTPEIFFGCLLQGKLTLAECFGLANPFWSWQQVLIGDPLYRPFRRQGFPATTQQYVGLTK